MVSNVHIVNQTDSLSQKNTSPSLHNGSVVKGRVVSVTGPNSYTVNVAGQNLNVTSSVSLKAGSVFDAKIIVQGNQVIFRLLNGGEGAELKSMDSSSFKTDNPAVKAFLNNLGLPALPESLKLVQFALSMGIPAEPYKLVRAFNQAKEGEKKFSLHKAQTSLLAQEKGIVLTGEAVEALTQAFDGESGKGKSGQDKKDKNNNHQTGNEEQKDVGCRMSLPLENKITADSVKDYFIECDEAAENNKPGLLTLFNSLLPLKKDESHWLILPFEWDHNNCSGVIRVLLGSDKKNVEKIIVNFNNDSKKSIFVLYFKQKKITHIKAAFKGNFEASFIEGAQEGLKKVFSGVSTQITDFNELEGFAAEDIRLGTFEGEA